MNQNLMVEGVWDKDEYGNWYLKNKKTGDIVNYPPPIEAGACEEQAIVD